MFEDSTFESTGRIRTRSRGWMLATFIFNSAVLVALALFPLLYPEALPRVAYLMLMTAPPPQQQAPQPPQPQRLPRVSPVSEIVGQRLMAPPVIPRFTYVPATQEPPQIGSVASMDIGPQTSGTGAGVFRGHPGPSVRPEPQQTARVSGGVMDGLLIRKVIPEYPPIARTMGIGGTVVLQATISKSGTIENLRVVSGPEMLRQSAINAVSQWRYQPYLLSGEPVEVETTINVQFALH
ncbi:MAG TPA: TonB family protein [Terracidiphilus sp.]|nr:TonB family protein [Terracidiphilus sp.]